MHFLLISENAFCYEMKCNRMTSFMEFVIGECPQVRLPKCDLGPPLLHSSRPILADLSGQITAGGFGAGGGDVVHRSDHG